MNDTTLNALVHEEEEEEMNDSNQSESLIVKTPNIKQTSNKNEPSNDYMTKFDYDDDDDDGDTEIKPLTTKTSLKSCSSNVSAPKEVASFRDTIYLDSDGESGIVELVKNDDEFYSKPPVIPILKSKEQKQKPQQQSSTKSDNQSDLYFDEKSIYPDEIDENEIEEVDFGDSEPKNSFSSKQAMPIIKQNSHISAIKSNQTTVINSLSASASQVFYSN